MAWQLAAHWGNRASPGPLRGGGRVGRPPDGVGLGRGGAGRRPGSAGGRSAQYGPRPLALDRRPAAHLSRYGRPAAGRPLRGAGRGAADDPAVVAPSGRHARRFAEWQETLAGDARYQRVLAGAGLAVNVALLAPGRRWSGPGGAGAARSRPAPDRTGSPVEVTLAPLGDLRWRVHPWPLQGERLQLHCEGVGTVSWGFDRGAARGVTSPPPAGRSRLTTDRSGLQWATVARAPQ